MFGIFTYPKRLNNLYADAVLVWLFGGNNETAMEDALEIASGAFVTAAREQRESMANYIDAAVTDLKNSSDNEEAVTAMQQRVMALKLSCVQACDDGMNKNRSQMKAKTRTAVQKGDETYFRSDSQLAYIFENI